MRATHRPKGGSRNRRGRPRRPRAHPAEAVRCYLRDPVVVEDWMLEGFPMELVERTVVERTAPLDTMGHGREDTSR